MSNEFEQMEAMLNSRQPIDMLDACSRVAKFLLQEFDNWAGIMAKSGDACLAETGMPITPADPILGGLVLALVHLVMTDANAKGIDLLCQHLEIPEPAKPGVRRRLNALFDGLGLHDDTHLLN